MVRAYDDNGNVIDLVGLGRQIRADAIDEKLQSFAQWLWDSHYLVDEAFTIRLVEQYNAEKLKEKKGMSWGISPNATEKEKIFADFNDSLQGINSEYGLSYYLYSNIYNIGRKLADKEYQQGRAEGESIGITRVLDILEHLDTQMLQMVKDALYEQDYNELKEKR